MANKENYLKHGRKQDNDYESNAVPLNNRKSFWGITIVWLGFVFVVTSMITGGGLAEGLNFKDILLTVIIGNIFLTFIAMAVANMAAKTGLSFALMTRYSFGIKGSKIATLFVPIVSIGWYTIQSAIFGHFVSNIFGITGVGELIILFLSAIVMGIFAFKGMDAITVLGYVAIPAIVFLSTATAIQSSNIIGLSAIANYVPKNEISIIEGVTIVIGTWIFSAATAIADIMRFAKSPKDAMKSAAVGLIFGNSLLIICGAIAAIGSNNSDLTEVLLGLGLVVPSLILMTTNIFTTNAANMYSSSLNLANSFSKDRKKIIVIILLISGFLCLTRPYEIDVLFSFLNALGVIVPPLAGIILADYYIVHKGEYNDLKSTESVDWSFTPWLTWIISLVLVYGLIQVYNVNDSALTRVFGLPALNGIVISLIIYPMISKLNRKEN